MADLSPILVQVKLEADKMKADLDATSGKLKNFGDTADAQGSKVSGLGQHVKTLVAGFLGMAALQKSVEFLKESGKAAAEDAKSAALLETQLKNTVGATKDQTAAVEDSIKAMQNQYGVMDDNIRPAYAAILRSTKDVGEATKLTDLAMNVSAGTGRSLESVSLALAKAHTGNFGALQRLIPGIKDAKDPMAELTKQFAGAGEKAANTDPYQRLAVAMDNIKEAVGKAVLPLISKFADVLLKAEPYISKFVDSLMNMGKGGVGIGQLTSMISPFGMALTLLKPVLPMLVDAVGQLAVTLGGALGDAFKTILPPIMELAGILSGILAEAIKIIMPVIVLLADVVGKTLAEVLKIVAPIIALVAEVLGTLLKALAPVIESVLSLASEALSALLAAILPIIKEAMPLLNDLIAALLPIIKPLAEFIIGVFVFNLKATIAVLKVIIEVVINVIKWFADLVASTIKTAKNVFDFFGGLGAAIQKVLNDAGAWLLQIGKDIINGLLKGLKAAWDTVVNWLIGAGNTLIDSFKKLFGIASPSKVFDGFGKNMMQGLANGIGQNVDLVHGALGGLEFGEMNIGLGRQTLRPGLGASTSAGNRIVNSSSSNSAFNTTVNVSTNASAQEIARSTVNAIRFGLPTTIRTA